ncbi:hypothetical protein AVEN_15456-1 [Araneus ventricosus]|uniref:Uncharacterized protein n=1 Tax=Araneus ventricosus TaxID=182803 RepID=A0A4Y2EBZ5_ARAVE|nr:hypothetical protein AVEN_15456-1 [Araneus ventricosus]
MCIPAILGENLTEIVPKCRTERGFGLTFEDYKLDTCARCYVYLPSFAFVSPERKLRYNPNTGLLYDMSTNTSCAADPDNTSHPVYDTFQSDLFARKWIACCRAAIECCHKMQADPPPQEALTVAPSRIAIRLLDGERTPQSLLQLPLVLDHTEIPICNISKMSDKAIVQQIANLSFEMSKKTLPLSSLFLPWHVLE